MKVVAKVSEIPEGCSKLVKVNGVNVTLYKVNGVVHALHDTCPHAGASLAEGELEGEVVTCPWHAWQYNVTTGACLTVPQNRLRRYPIQIDGDRIKLEIDA